MKETASNKQICGSGHSACAQIEAYEEAEQGSRFCSLTKPLLVELQLRIFAGRYVNIFSIYGNTEKIYKEYQYVFNILLISLININFKESTLSYFNFQGKKIFYSVKGEGPLLIILPGNTATSAAHENELTYFSARYCTVSLDFLGTGKSDRIEQWNSNWWEECSHQVAALVEHLNYKEAILLGISGGAIIAIAAAINHPDNVKAVVADSFSLHFTEEMYKNNVLIERANNTEQQQTFWSWMHGSDWKDVINADTKMIEMVVKEGGLCINGQPEKIECPVLLTYSEEDSFLPNVKEIADDLVKKINNCDAKIFSKGGHPLIWTNPTEFFPVVEEFLLKL